MPPARRADRRRGRRGHRRDASAPAPLAKRSAGVRITRMPPTPSAAAPKLLLIDSGNSRTKIGVFEAPPVAPDQLPNCRAYLALDNEDAVPWEQLVRLLELPGGVTADWVICLTGSNPARTAEVRGSLPSEWPRPVELPERRRLPLAIDVDLPEQVGIDRLLNAIAANRLRREGQPAVIVSSGTATTVDYVDPAGRFCGGAILPGFELAARSLHEYTALLPLVPLEPVLASPPVAIGRNTAAAIRAGLYWGHVGAVRELLRHGLHRGAQDQNASGAADGRHLGNLAVDQTPLAIVTGGAAPLLLPHLPSFCRHEPYLPLQGLALVVWELQRQPETPALA